MSFVKNIHLYYQKITQLFPQIIDAYPETTEKIIFLGDLFYAFVIQNNIDIFTPDTGGVGSNPITRELLQDYLAFYYKIKSLNMDRDTIIREHDEHYKIKINSIMNTYNDYFINNHLNHNINTEFVFDMSRFRGLKEVMLSDILIHSIVQIPNTVKIFHITHCMLKRIDRIPFSAEYVNCAYNQLPVLPDMNHNAYLKILICNNNFITKLPRLPDSVNRLFCNCNLITVLPAHLPRQLKILYCNNNRITRIGVLPTRLHIFSCGYNRLKELSNIMHLSHLKILYCNNNLLEELPPLPIAIQEINHTNNPIQNYFPYPTGVRVLL
jgi:hypothetical protein